MEKNIFKYNSSIDTLDFNLSDITKNNVSLTDLNQFDNKLESFGYQKFPGGLTMQWGRVDYDSFPPEGDINVYFPISYTNACLNAQVSRIIKQNSPFDANDGGMLVVDYTKTTLIASIAYFTRDNYFLRGFTWLAIGH